MNRKELRQKGKSLFQTDYWSFVLAYLIYSGIISAASSSYGVPVLIVGGPLLAGFILFNLNFIRKGNAKITDLFENFKRFTDFFLTFLLETGLVLLWTLLFIVPGIIKSLAYSQAIYIMLDNPGITPKEALNRSEKMMYGHKKELFLLMLSFIGWHILSILTLGILEIFYVGPYYNATLALYYEELKNNQVEIIEK